MKLAGEAGLSTTKGTWFKARQRLGIKPIHADEFQGQWLLALPEHQIKVQIRRSPKAGETH
jgi:hypothetical protein